jgi:molecular chaperone GrpE
MSDQTSSDPAATEVAANDAPPAAAQPAPAEAPAIESAASAPPPETRIAALEEELNRAKDDVLRAKAETENTRRRAQADIASAHKYASETFAESLVPVKDSLEAALADSSASLETLKSGVELTLKQLVAAFERARVAEINPAGAKFDPRFHQAISMVESDAEPNQVIAVLQKGYRLHERVLRPALVSVAKAREA